MLESYDQSLRIINFLKNIFRYLKLKNLSELRDHIHFHLFSFLRLNVRASFRQDNIFVRLRNSHSPSQEGGDRLLVLTHVLEAAR
jgi:hypothetical protein